jgi:hypothetical protein
LHVSTDKTRWPDKSLPGRFSADPRPGGGAHFPLITSAPAAVPMEPLDSACYADPMIEIAAVLLVIATSVAMLMLLGEH